MKYRCRAHARFYRAQYCPSETNATALEENNSTGCIVKLRKAGNRLSWWWSNSHFQISFVVAFLIKSGSVLYIGNAEVFLDVIGEKVIV